MAALFFLHRFSGIVFYYPQTCRMQRGYFQDGIAVCAFYYVSFVDFIIDDYVAVANRALGCSHNGFILL